MAANKRVVSVSLGTSRRDKTVQTEMLGVPLTRERRGTDGSKARFQAILAELDGIAACFGIGGTDAYLHAGTRRYAFRETLALMEPARITPWVDGSGLKHTLERATVAYLQDQGIVDFGKLRVLLVAGVDRFGMAEALACRARSIAFGDLAFGLGIPIAVRSWAGLRRLAAVALPLVVRMPISWLYPTGEKQDRNTPKFGHLFAEADVIAGDWHIIRRYMPERLDGKIILTQSSRADETELLRRRGAKLLITTTPEIGGVAFATNVMEAALVAVLGKRPAELTTEDYLGTLTRLGWTPSVQSLEV